MGADKIEDLIIEELTSLGMRVGGTGQTTDTHWYQVLRDQLVSSIRSLEKLQQCSEDLSEFIKYVKIECSNVNCTLDSARALMEIFYVMCDVLEVTADTVRALKDCIRLLLSDNHLPLVMPEKLREYLQIPIGTRRFIELLPDRVTNDNLPGVIKDLEVALNAG